MSGGFHLPVAGPFSLIASIRFLEGFGPAAHRPGPPGHLQIAFPVEGDWRTVGVDVHQVSDVELAGEFLGDSPAKLVASQVARILSVDVDGTGFAEVGGRDPVVGRLQERYPGLRPVCFWSAYEAAVWAVISHRIRISQAAAIKQRISEEHGERVEVFGNPVMAFPSPSRLLELRTLSGLDERKLSRLHAVAQAALDGWLNSSRLRATAAPEALDRLGELPGIGPFFAELILLRGAGEPDTFPSGERRLHAAVAALYDLDQPNLEQLAGVAETWRPYRTWVSVLIRRWWEDQGSEIAGPER